METYWGEFLHPVLCSLRVCWGIHFNAPGHHPSALVEEHACAQCRRTLSPHPAVSTSAAILPLAVTLETMGPQRRLVPAACGPHGRFSLQLFVSWFVSLSSGRLPVLRQSPLPL